MREAQDGGDILLIADSCCCTTVTNTMLWNSYPLIKNKNSSYRLWKVSFFLQKNVLFDMLFLLGKITCNKSMVLFWLWNQSWYWLDSEKLAWLWNSSWKIGRIDWELEYGYKYIDK